MFRKLNKQYQINNNFRSSERLHHSKHPNSFNIQLNLKLNLLKAFQINNQALNLLFQLKLVLLKDRLFKNHWDSKMNTASTDQ